MFSCWHFLAKNAMAQVFLITSQMSHDQVITLNYYPNREMDVPVRDGMTVLDLKHAACNYWGFEDPVRIRLILAGRPLEDHEAVSELNIGPDDVVYLLRRLQG